MVGLQISTQNNGQHPRRQDSLATQPEMINASTKKLPVWDEAVMRIDQINLYEIFQQTVRVYPDFDCLAQSTPATDDQKVIYKYYTYKEIDVMVSKIAAYFLSLKIEPKDGEKVKVGMWMSTSMCMRVLMLACNKANFTIVPVYDALGMENVEKIFSKTSVSIVCVDKLSYYEKVMAMESIQPNIKKLIKTLSHIDNSTQIENPSENYVFFDDILQETKEASLKDVVFPDVDPSEVAYLLSTSGSSGEPKSIELSHRNISCIIKSFRMNFDPIRRKVHPNSQVTSYMFLPLAHIFGMLVDFALFSLNGRVAYPSGNIAVVLKSDLDVVKPELLTCVPLILQRAYDATMTTVSKLGIVKRSIFNVAYLTGYLSAIAFKQVRQSLGGKLMVVACGGSPLSGDLYQFVKRVIGAKCVVGYGLTEGLISCQQLNNWTCDLGPPFDFVETKIIDVPEMNYFTSQNQGELCVKGASIFNGYYKNDEETKKAFDNDGYFKTGDIVEINLIKKDRSDVDAMKVIKYIDRSKNIFKLNQGEYVAPSEIEGLYQLSDTCNSYFLYGDSTRSFCVGIGFIDKNNLHALAKKLEIKLQNDLTDQKIIDTLKPKIIKRLNEQVQCLPSFKRAKAWHFTTEIPTVENDMLTPTQKMKRFVVKSKFQNEIEKLCQEVEAPYLK